MKFKVTPGVEPAPVIEPHCVQTVPQRFVAALTTARRFLGRHNLTYPWVQYVFLDEGKLYASDNRCIVEIDLSAPGFGRARFSALDIKLLTEMGNPDLASFTTGETAFRWHGGSWCRFPAQHSGFEMAERCGMLLDQFWHEGRPIAPETSSTIRTLAKKERGVIRFKAASINEVSDQRWHGEAISKVMAIATHYDPDATPASFTFPNGRGLIVKPSGGRIK